MSIKKIRAFYARNTESVHPEMPNSNVDDLSDDEVMAMYNELCKSLEDMTATMRKIGVTYPEVIHPEYWIYQLIELQDALLEDILLGQDDPTDP